MNKRISTSKGLIIVFAVAVIVFGGAYTWASFNQPSLIEDFGGRSLTVTKPLDIEKETSEWKTYQNKSYGVSFKYPKEWPTPKEEKISKDDEPILVASTYLDFNSTNKAIQYSADISNFSGYGAAYSKDLEKLKTIFASKKVDGNEKLWLPPSNAMIVAHSKTSYIETPDKKYRGLYFFANIGQDISTDLDCLIIMTDGTENIIQIHIAGKSIKASDYQKQNITQNEKAQKDFQNYVKSLTSKSTDEPIIKDFASTYSVIAKSIKGIEKQAEPVAKNSGYKIFEGKSGYTLEYPEGWTATQHENSLTLKSSETQKRYDDLTASGAATEGPAPEFSITYYENIQAADGNVPKKYSNLLEMVSDEITYSGAKEIQFAGLKAYEAIQHVMGDYYSILFEQSGHIYLILTDKENRSALTAEQQAVLNSFSF